MSVIPIKVDKEAGILPVNRLAERKLQVKSITSFDWTLMESASITEMSYITYKFLMVTGKLDGMLPPMLLLLRSLPPKYTANSENDAEETYIYCEKEDNWNWWTEGNAIDAHEHTEKCMK